ncbi:TadE family type IV pilus minor pilin [Microbacterium soli]|uniref:TadE-like domain-containing protein n=1 Tax=Microbacterium soli TaxID=446075 RepID=A0ABP7NCH5_9MICO
MTGAVRGRGSAADHDARERGSVVAELAIALPAVLLTLLLGVGALHTAATQVALQDAAADAARLLGRGEGADRAAGVVRASVDGARMSASDADDLVCVTASARVGVGRLISIPLRMRSCALRGGL